jgi:hypothetical protein
MATFGNDNKDWVYEQLQYLLKESPITLKDLFDILSIIAERNPEIFKEEAK